VVALSDFESPLITTGNSEIDKKIGGGLPPNSLTLFEGQPDAGKSVLVQQFVWGCLQTNKRVTVYTTENTTISLLRQMKSLSLDVDDYFLLGRLDILTVPNSFPEDADSLYTDLLRHIASKQVDVVFVDALTAFASHASERQTLDFFSRAKQVCDSGVSLIVTLHSYATTEQMMTRLSSICDAHLRLRVEDLGTQLVKVIEVSKVRGATKTTGNVVSFDVEPNFGMKIIPITKAKA
jgi:archaeal flagellar protein FlaH